MARRGGAPHIYDNLQSCASQSHSNANTASPMRNSMRLVPDGFPFGHSALKMPSSAGFKSGVPSPSSNRSHGSGIPFTLREGASEGRLASPAERPKDSYAVPPSSKQASSASVMPWLENMAGMLFSSISFSRVASPWLIASRVAS